MTTTSDTAATTATGTAPLTAITYPDLDRPPKFTQDELGWVPWLPSLPIAEFTERHWKGVVDKRRAENAYFALLARDPEILEARTKTDNDIFYNTQGGLPRAERELSAAAASRSNGCIYCASVHSRFAAHYSKRPEDVQRLLDEGVGVSIDLRWDAIIGAAVDLTETPVAFDANSIGALRDNGLTDLEIADAIHGAAFFNWANRLMLSLGEPEAPQK
jgi:alkylhydroperoxidase domain protein